MRTTRRILVVLASIALIFGVAACGGGGDDDDGVASLDGSDGETAAADDDDGGGGGGPRGVDETAFRDAMLEYTECMRDHGIDMPDPQFEGEGRVIVRGGPGEDEGGIDPESEEFQAAEEECRPLMEDALPDLDLDPEEQAEMQDRMLDFAQCMRDKGHDFPDPVFSDDGGPSINVGPGGGGGRGPAGDFDDPAFQEDLEDCREESGGGGFFGGSVSQDDEGDGE